MKKTIAIGIDDFKTLREENHYFIDKSLPSGPGGVTNSMDIHPSGISQQDFRCKAVRRVPYCPWNLHKGNFAHLYL